jgi:hypothetical protein
MKPRVATLDLLEHLATSHVCSTSCWSAPTLTTRCLPRIPLRTCIWNSKVERVNAATR